MSITLRNTMTGKEWHFYIAAGLTELGAEIDGVQVATFAYFEPGLYSVINDGAEDVQVILWGQTYTVGANSKWDFMAHQEVGSISPLVATTADERYRGDGSPVGQGQEAGATQAGADTTAGGAASTPTDTTPNP